MLGNLKEPKKIIYLDHAATTPVDPAVLKAMQPYWIKHFGNPSSLYRQGTEARLAVDESRKKIAGIIGARPQEIIFTAGGTESCNLAIFGVARNFKPAKGMKPHIITTAIEHHAVLGPVNMLGGLGYQVSLLKVDRAGVVSIKDLQKAIRPETILVSVMFANNEIGTIEPIAEVGKLLQRINTERVRKGFSKIVFHTDACQAAGALDLNVGHLNVDLMSANGSKMYGPKQTGFLFVRTGINLKPYILGGGQEHNLRSGTENVPGIVGLTKAFELREKNRNKENERLRKLQDYFIFKLVKIPGVELNGPDPRAVSGEPARLPNNTNISVKGVEGEALTLYLDSYGIEVSTGSACTTGMAEPSHVLLAIGGTSKAAKSSIRLTMGKTTTKPDLDYTLKVITALIKQLRETNNFLL